MSAPVTVTATTGTSAPVVTLNAPTATATLGNTINFSATASDAGGVVTTVAFYVNGNQISTDDTTPYVGSFTPTATGVYEITAVALDDSGNETVSNVSTVTVNPVAGTAPSVVLNSPVPAGTTGGNTPASLTVGQASTLNLIAQVTPGSAAISDVKFYAVSAQNGPTQIGSGTLVSAGTFLYQNSYASALTVGDYNLVAVVTDAAGNTATSDTVGIKVVQTATAAPTITISEPSPATLKVDASTLLSATATAAVGSAVDSVEFYVNGQSVGKDDEAPYNLQYKGTITGSYVAFATVTDKAGNTNVSASRAFSVVESLGEGLGVISRIEYPTDGQVIKLYSDQGFKPASADVITRISGSTLEIIEIRVTDPGFGYLSTVKPILVVPGVPQTELRALVDASGRITSISLPNTQQNFDRFNQAP
jgi:hypothetical protein